MSAAQRGQRCCGVRTVTLWVFACYLLKALSKTAVRALYPYAPQIAAATGSDVETVSALIASMRFGYMSAPLAVPLLLQHTTYLRAFAGTTAVQSACVLAIGFSTHVVGFAIPVVLMGVCSGVSDSVISAGVRLFVPKNDRTRTVGMIELSWGTSSIAWVPLVGLLLSLSWKAPFLIFGAAMVCVGCPLALTISRLVAPPDSAAGPPPPAEPPRAERPPPAPQLAPQPATQPATQPAAARVDDVELALSPATALEPAAALTSTAAVTGTAAAPAAAAAAAAAGKECAVAPGSASRNGVGGEGGGSGDGGDRGGDVGGA